MVIRLLKVMMVSFVGLQGMLYVIGNIANWSAAHSAVGYVLSMADHHVYSTPIFVSITNPLLVSVALCCIIAGEFLVAVLAFKGAWSMSINIKASSAQFHAAKKYALLGCGMAMIVWFGGFIVIGGALFQMWQTEIGNSSFEGAFIYGSISCLTLLFVNAVESD